MQKNQPGSSEAQKWNGIANTFLQHKKVNKFCFNVASMSLQILFFVFSAHTKCVTAAAASGKRQAKPTERLAKVCFAASYLSILSDIFMFSAGLRLETAASKQN